MNQEKNRELLLELHHVITGSKKTCEQIVNERKIDPEITLIYQTELSGHVSSGSTVSVKDYYMLDD
jgi:hypothetical protein